MLNYMFALVTPLSIGFLAVAVVHVHWRLMMLHLLEHSVPVMVLIFCRVLLFSITVLLCFFDDALRLFVTTLRA